MLIDCDSCTARGDGCADCVVTVLLGAPPAEAGGDTVVLPLAGRPRDVRAGRPAAPATGRPAPRPAGPAPLSAEDVVVPRPGVVVEFDEIERRAVQVLADAGLVPPLRHRPAPPSGLAERRGRPGGQPPAVSGRGRAAGVGERRGRRTG